MQAGTGRSGSRPAAIAGRFEGPAGRWSRGCGDPVAPPALLSRRSVRTNEIERLRQFSEEDSFGAELPRELATGRMINIEAIAFAHAARSHQPTSSAASR
jgi:hypothetical protein